MKNKREEESKLGYFFSFNYFWGIFFSNLSSAACFIKKEVWGGGGGGGRKNALSPR